MTYRYPPAGELGAGANDEIEFAQNPEQRCPVILLCDISASMEHYVDEVNAGLRSFQRVVSRDAVAAERVELAVLAFSDEVEISHGFALMRNFVPPTLMCKNLTDTALAVETAIDLLRARKEEYRRNGIPYYRPWLFLISDGLPTSSAEALYKAQAKLTGALHDNELVWFPIGLDHESVEALNDNLVTGTQAKMLRHDRWGEFFIWLSNSVGIMSRSAPGDRIRLLPTDPWSGDIEIY